MNNNAGKTEKLTTVGNLMSKAPNQTVERVDSKSMTSYQFKDNLNQNKRSFSLNKGLNRKSVEKLKH